MKDNAQVDFLDELLIQEDEDLQANLSHRLENTTRKSGSRIFVVFTSKQRAAMILQTVDHAFIGGSGYAWVLGSDTFVGVGEIALNSSTDENFESLSLPSTGPVGFLDPQMPYLAVDPANTVYVALTLIAQAYTDLGYPITPYIYICLLYTSDAADE